MNQKKIGLLDQKINELIKLGKPMIAFGLEKIDNQIIASLKKSRRYAEIILVCPPTIKDIAGFKIVIAEKPEEKIAEMLWNNEVEGIVRGTIDDFKTYEAYQKMSGENDLMNPGIMDDGQGRQFFLSPVSNPEAWDKEDRLSIARQIAEFMRYWELVPKIAVFAGVRHDTYPRRKDIREGVVGILNKTYEDAEYIVAELKKDGYEAKNWSIDLNPAVEAGVNVVIPVNGMVGNQIFRAMMICGGKVMSCPRWGLSRCYEDNSRTEKDFEPHMRWLVAWINSRKKISEK